MVSSVLQLKQAQRIRVVSKIVLPVEPSLLRPSLNLSTQPHSRTCATTRHLGVGFISVLLCGFQLHTHTHSP